MVGAKWSATELKFNVFKGSLHALCPFSAVAVHSMFFAAITLKLQTILKWNIVAIFKKFHLLDVHVFHCACL
jgi:hypothetical protein